MGPDGYSSWTVGFFTFFCCLGLGLDTFCFVPGEGAFGRAVLENGWGSAMFEHADAVDPLGVGFFMVGSDYALHVWWHVLEQADRGVALELTEFGCFHGSGLLEPIIYRNLGRLWRHLIWLRYFKAEQLSAGHGLCAGIMDEGRVKLRS